MLKKIYESKKAEKICWLEGLEEEFEHFYEILEKTLLKMSLWARAEISPLYSFLGGVSAQEILKENIVLFINGFGLIFLKLWKI